MSRIRHSVAAPALAFLSAFLPMGAAHAQDTGPLKKIKDYPMNAETGEGFANPSFKGI